MTVPEFSANYNHYLHTFNKYHTKTDRLQKDGTFYPELSNTVTIYIDGTPAREHYAFDYVTEGEKLTQICYSNSWSNVTYLDPVVSQCKTAAITAVMSQTGMKKDNLIEFASLMDSEMLKQCGEIEYEGVRIKWTSEAMECSFISGHYIADNDAAEPTVTLEFAITLP